MTYPVRTVIAGGATAFLDSLCAAAVVCAENLPSPDGSTAAPAPPLFTWGGYFQALGLMCLLLALLWFAVWVVRRSGKFNFLPMPGALSRDDLRMEAQLPLGQKKSLVVVRFLNRRLLLGITDQRITLLKEMGLSDDPEDPVSIGRQYPASERSGPSRPSGQLFERLLRGARAGTDGLESGPGVGKDSSAGPGTDSGPSSSRPS